MKWTEKEDKILKENLNLSNKELSKLLNTTVNAIQCRKKRLKLNKPVEQYIPIDEEEFKSIVETNNRYSISNFGNIINNKNNRLMKQTINPDGYPGVRLFNGYDENKKELHYNSTTHRLVAKYFVNNPKPNLYNSVNHIDGNKLNNHYTNLEWCNQQYQVDHAIKNNLSNPQTASAKLTEDQVIEVCKLLTEHKLTQKQIAEKFGVKKDVIGGIKRGKHWTNISKDYIDKF